MSNLNNQITTNQNNTESVADTATHISPVVPKKTYTQLNKEALQDLDRHH